MNALRGGASVLGAIGGIGMILHGLGALLGTVAGCLGLTGACPTSGQEVWQNLGEVVAGVAVFSPGLNSLKVGPFQR